MQLLYTVSQKRTNFETGLLKVIRINFDDIRQKHPKYSRIEFVCFRHLKYTRCPIITKFIPVAMAPKSRAQWVVCTHQNAITAMQL